MQKVPTVVQIGHIIASFTLLYTTLMMIEVWCIICTSNINVTNCRILSPSIQTVIMNLKQQRKKREVWVGFTHIRLTMMHSFPTEGCASMIYQCLLLGRTLFSHQREKRKVNFAREKNARVWRQGWFSIMIPIVVHHVLVVVILW